MFICLFISAFLSTYFCTLFFLSFFLRVKQLYSFQVCDNIYTPFFFFLLLSTFELPVYRIPLPPLPPFKFDLGNVFVQ